MFLDRLCLVVTFDIQSTSAQSNIIFTLSKPVGPLYCRASDFNKQTFVATCPAINVLPALFHSPKIVFSDLFLYCL